MRKNRGDSDRDRLSRESGVVRRRWRNCLPVALLFPNAYRVGMSNLGFQLVYRLVNETPGFVCERFFLPDHDGPAKSVESGRPLRDFGIILCSISFEDDFVRLASLLMAAGIDPLAVSRSDGASLIEAGRPLLVGGGVAMFMNPEPVAPFFDLIAVGEAEVILPQLLEKIAHPGAASVPRSDVLRELAVSVPGCYIPSCYEFNFDATGVLRAIEARSGVPSRVRRVVVRDKEVAGHSELFSPDAEFSNMFLAELGRGCSRSCRFCAAGFVYRPPRLWQTASVLAALQNRPPHIDRVGLLGMEMARPDGLAAISAFLLAAGCALSFSSLRADAVGEELLGLLAASGLKSVTIAPDGGSDRLRRVINKNMSRTDILQAAEALLATGITRLKLYFMIGLPTETEEDLAELVDLVFEVRDTALAVGRGRGRVADLVLSVNCFVPKPWTPFQYYAFPSVKELRGKRDYLRKRFSGQAHVRASVESPANAFFQAVLARGDRRLAPVLLQIVKTGKGWRQLMLQEGLSPDLYAMRPRARQELFPWEIIDQGIDREYLWNEYQRALSGTPTPPCDVERCRRCGVCA